MNSFACGNCITSYLPREGPETIRQFEFLVRHARIATYQPREGPETEREIILIHTEVCIAPYLPREGPETVRVQGDPQVILCIAPYLPREGPETCPVIQISFCFSSYSYLSTSRGAGNTLFGEQTIWIDTV